MRGRVRDAATAWISRRSSQTRKRAAIPGFAVDEAALGSALKLPRFLQPRRAEIEAALPALA